MTAPSVRYTRRADAPPEVELGALAAVYRLVLDTAQKKGAASANRPEDARKDQDAGTRPQFT